MAWVVKIVATGSRRARHRQSPMPASHSWKCATTCGFSSLWARNCGATGTGPLCLHVCCEDNQQPPRWMRKQGRGRSVSITTQRGVAHCNPQWRDKLTHPQRLMGDVGFWANLPSPKRAELERLKFWCPQILNTILGNALHPSRVDLYPILAEGLQLPRMP